MPICISGLKRTSIYGQQKRGMIPYLFLLGYSDSNQEKQDQNLLCYHYTIAQTNGRQYFLRENFCRHK